MSIKGEQQFIYFPAKRGEKHYLFYGNSYARKPIYELDAVLQLIDDIQDTKEDLRSGIQTLPNQKLLDFLELKEMCYGTVNNLIEKCNIDINQSNETLDILCWFADILLEKRYGSFIKYK